MGRKCVVPYCTSGYESNKEKVSLFKIPPNKLDQWAEVIPRKDRPLTTRDYVCAKHFMESDIIRELRTDVYTIKLLIPRLSSTAVPSVFSVCPTPDSNQRPRITVKALDELRPKIQEVKDNSVYLEVTEITGSDSIFDVIWYNDSKPKLPSRAWAVHYCETPFIDTCLISITENVIFEGDTVERKKVVISKSDVKSYIFGNIVSNKIALHQNEIDSLEELENSLAIYDSLNVCGGGFAAVIPANFKHKNFKLDRCNVWRHISCSYMENISRTRDGRSYKCIYCKKMNMAVRTFRHAEKKRKKIKPSEESVQELSEVK